DGLATGTLDGNQHVSSRAACLEDLLLFASQANSLLEVNRLLHQGADPNVADEDGETPLFEAAASGNVDITATLLLHSADPGYRSMHGMVAGDLAADSRVKTLLDLFQGKAVGAEAKESAMAGLKGSLRQQVAEHLQRAGTESGRVHSGGLKLDVESVKAEGAALNVDPDQTLQPSASAASQAEILFVQSDIVPGIFSQAEDAGEAPLLEAVQGNDLFQVEQLLQNGAMPNAADALGETPLFEAAASGNVDITATLLLHSADPGYRSMHGMVAGDLAADSRVKTLLDLFQGKAVGAEAKEAAMAGLKGSLRQQVAEHLQRAGTESGRVHSGGLKLDVESVKAEGAALNVDPDQTLQPSASAASQAEILFVQSDIVPETLSQAEDAGEAPLLEAVQGNDLFQVEQLLQNGAMLNAADALGETPLFEAAAGGNVDITATLLLHSADPGYRSMHGMVAGDLAADSRVKTLLDLFQGKAVGAEAKEAAMAGLKGSLRQQVAEHLQRAGTESGRVHSGGLKLDVESVKAEGAALNLDTGLKLDGESVKAEGAVLNVDTGLQLDVESVKAEGAVLNVDTGLQLDVESVKAEGAVLNVDTGLQLDGESVKAGGAAPDVDTGLKLDVESVFTAEGAALNVDLGLKLDVESVKAEGAALNVDTGLQLDAESVKAEGAALDVDTGLQLDVESVKAEGAALNVDLGLQLDGESVKAEGAAPDVDTGLKLDVESVFTAEGAVLNVDLRLKLDVGSVFRAEGAAPDVDTGLKLDGESVKAEGAAPDVDLGLKLDVGSVFRAEGAALNVDLGLQLDGESVKAEGAALNVDPDQTLQPSVSAGSFYSIFPDHASHTEKAGRSCVVLPQ
ncbi:unnamed protein product, partial [Polarella glacialis]